MEESKLKMIKRKNDYIINRRRNKLILNHDKKYRNKNENNKRFIFLFYFLTFFMIILILFIFIIFNYNKKEEKYLKKELKQRNGKQKLINETKLEKNEILTEIINETLYDLEKINKEKTKIKEFTDFISKGELINPNEKFYKSNEPKISIVISIYNGEGYIKDALLSIQNQDFKDIEIIMVDDCSKDNSVNLIKELMLIDPRIVLYQNEENRGALYTKTKGVLNSKGKFVMLLDEDDLYAQKDSFSILYEEAERNNLDILAFSYIIGSPDKFANNKPSKYIETKILYQPDIIEKMYEHTSEGKIKKVGFTLFNNFIKTELFKKVIYLIEDKFFNITMNYNDDCLLFFLLTRNAFNFKQIKKIFYFCYVRAYTNQEINFRKKEKSKNYENILCLSNLNFVELLLLKTNNTYEDKKIASYEFELSYLNHYCRNNRFAIRKGIAVSTKIYNNKYIDKDIKKKIRNFFKEKRIKYRIKYK